MKTQDPQRSVRQIRRRLYTLLLQAFGLVVGLLVVMLLIGFGLFVGFPIQSLPVDDLPLFRQNLASSLEAYYLGHGNWGGVETLLSAQRNPEQITLRDETGQVIFPVPPNAATASGGFSYRIALTRQAQPIGTLIVDMGIIHSTQLIGRFFGPLIGLSTLPALLTLLIGVLLGRRMIMPLADIMAAARAVAAGELSARVPLSGPGDLRALSDSFNHMAETLEKNDLERRALLADVAHELRTPLTIIRGRLEGIVDGIYPAAPEQVTPVLEETYLLERLVEDLRLLALVEAGQLAFDHQPVNLGDLARHTTQLFEAEAAEKNLRLTLTVAPNLPAVSADPQRLEQVLGNLLSNAIRYIPAGSAIQISIQRQEAHIAVAVSDNGPGVPAEDLPHLFDRFWRTDKSRSRIAGGAGLGLSIARRLIEAQGGAISACNLPAGGLCLTFTLPSLA